MIHPFTKFHENPTVTFELSC